MATQARTKTLAELGLTARNGQDAKITGLSVDSREVKEGHLFAALPGTKVHGGEFIQYALRMRAGAVLTDREGAAIAEAELAESDVPLVVVEEPREALAFTAAEVGSAFEQLAVEPARKLPDAVVDGRIAGWVRHGILSRELLGSHRASEVIILLSLHLGVDLR